jgi:uridine kinase
VAAEVGGAVVPADDFFAAEIPATGWDARRPGECAADALDWRRLRRDALEPLLDGRLARWYAFDFKAGMRADGTYLLQATPTECAPAAIVIVDGAYTARPELADLVGLAVLVTASPEARRARLATREDAAFLGAWYARWGKAEAHYFTRVCTPDRFDMVVATD